MEEEELTRDEETGPWRDDAPGLRMTFPLLRNFIF